ncbi:MAG: hypothetical protein KJO98_16950, partial [Rhodothermia bacterium]|nr:hypothetical protein [Rhodothermia bacterium]
AANPELTSSALREYLAQFRFPSTWVVLAENERALGKIATDQRWKPLQRDEGVGLWTDDYSNIVRVLEWKKKVAGD